MWRRMQRGRAAHTAALLGLVVAVLLSACSDTAALEKRVKALEEKATAAEAQVKTSSAGGAAAAGATTAIREYKDYGFAMPLPEGIQVKAAGLGAGTVSKQEGQLTSSAGDTSMVLVWTSSKTTAEATVQGAFQVLSASQPALSFQPLNEGKFKVDAKDGAFGAFGALDKEKAVVGVGVVGGWTCGDGRSYALTVAGKDLLLVQSSFAGFTGTFRCAA